MVRKTLLGEIGLPDTVEKISSCASVRLARAFHAVSNYRAAVDKGMIACERLAAKFGPLRY